VLKRLSLNEAKIRTLAEGVLSLAEVGVLTAPRLEIRSMGVIRSLGWAGGGGESNRARRVISLMIKPITPPLPEDELKQTQSTLMKWVCVAGD
jgi:hypothetical protein